MRNMFVVPLLACITACSNLTPAQQAQVQQMLTVACNVDGAVVPATQPVVAKMGAAGANALLVHPAVVAACGEIGGVPASAAPVVPTTVPAAG